MTSNLSQGLKSTTDLSAKLITPTDDKNPHSKKSSRTDAQQAVDRVNIQMKEVYKGLTVLGDEIIKKLNEVLAEDLPDGIQSLKPEDHTAEATADRIVSGVLAMFSAYSKQNPDLEGEELLNSFMTEARKGIKQGYEDAMGILEGIGALEFDNVASGIEQTMKLVEEKLLAFEENYRKDLQPAEEEAAESSEETQTEEN